MHNVTIKCRAVGVYCLEPCPIGKRLRYAVMFTLTTPLTVGPHRVKFKTRYKPLDYNAPWIGHDVRIDTTYTQIVFAM